MQFLIIEINTNQLSFISKEYTDSSLADLFWFAHESKIEYLISEQNSIGVLMCKS